MAIINSINLSSLDGSNGFRLDGVAAEDFSGYAVSNAGDVNGDGFDDVIVGARGSDPNGNSSGSSYVVFGRASGFDAAMDLSILDGSSGFRLDGANEFDSLGASVSNAGDVNGDGFDDLIMGAPYTDLNGSYSGSSYVVFGRASGFDAAMDLSSLDGNNGFRLDDIVRGQSASGTGDINGDGLGDVIISSSGRNDDYSSPVTVDYVVFGKASGFSASMNLSDLNGSNGFRLDVGTYNAVTTSVSSAGDINGDGYDDAIVGIVFPSNNRGAIRSTESYVIFGHAFDFGAAVNLSNLDGSNGFRLTGADANLHGGKLGVSDAGDVNGDGFGDVIIGAPGDSRSGHDSGASFVVFGRASGFDASIDLSSLDGNNGFRVDGGEALNSLGRSVSGAGDVNGDGFDDVIIGVSSIDPNVTSSGFSYVVFGKASGFDAVMNIFALDSSTGVRLDGSSLVSGAGDVNGDGLDDLLMGDSSADPNGNASGSSYVVFGSSNFRGTRTFVGTPGDDNFTGTSADERFEVGDGNDTMTGGGGADVFLGGDGDDVIRVPDLTFQTLDGGSGTDTLELTSGSIDLDLANVHNKIDGIDVIDLTGGDDDTLTLTLTNLLEVSDRTLKVNGDAGDRVVIRGGGWIDGGIDGGYHTYTNSGQTMLQINVAVSTDPPLLGGVFSLSSLDGSNGFRMDGEMYDLSGRSVSTAGDVNGDGFDDVIIGAPGAAPSGISYVVFGRASGFDAAMDLSSLDGGNGFHLYGEASNLSLAPVSDAGDVNGDGFGDLIVGAYGANSGYVVFGQASGFDAAMDLSALDGSNGFRLDGGAEAFNTGRSVSSAGDVNGDGFDDVMISTYYAGLNYNSFGASFVVFGKASGFDAALDLSSLDGSNGFRLDGETAYAGTRISVSNAGDINGDGFADVIIGDSLADPNGDRSGSSYVVFGRASGFDAAINLSSLDGNNGFRLNGAARDDYSGSSVSNAGDINGDGFGDVIIGAPGADLSDSYSGSSYVVFGKASGFDAILNLASLDGSNGFRLDGAYGGGVGNRVSSAGDVNGDGFADVLISSSGGGLSAPSYVVFGKASGFDATLDLSVLDGNNGVRLDGVTDFNTGGRSISAGAGDVNGDGFDDLLVGQDYASLNGDGSGSSYVIFGSRNFGRAGFDIVGTSGDDDLTGTPLAERFEAGGGNDRMTGRGGADIFHGGSGNDVIGVPDLDFQIINGGTGTDTLELMDSDINPDLANFRDRIVGIETIDLTGNGNNILTLTLPDLLSLSGTTDIFTVNGDAGDRVFGLMDGWTDGGIDGNYRIFTNHGTVLRINTAVSTDSLKPGINLADLNGSNGFRLDGYALDRSGSSVSNAGDVNGDGFDDVIVGASSYYGHSYVVFGRAAGFDAAMDLSSLDGTSGFRLDEGGTVSTAGDINGDGLDDLIFGVSGTSDYYGIPISDGDGFVVFGRASGFDAVIDLFSLDGSNGFHLDVAGSQSVPVSGAGDVNGDGFDDVIVGDSNAGSNGDRSGSSYVVFGKPSGFDAVMDLSSLDGNDGFRLDGVAAGDLSGGSVSNAGDVNGDDFDDVIVNGGGSSYVVFGKAAGFSAVMDLSSLDGSNGFRLDGASRSVSGAGDVNGDGLADLIVGTPRGGSIDSGSSYVIFGRASGFDAMLNLSSLDGNNGFRLDGVTAHDLSGYSVSGAGDVNGDRFDDVIVGAKWADPNGDYSGSSYVVFGRASGFSAAMNLSSLDGNNGIRLDGVAALDESGSSVSGAGDVNGDGFDDLMIGAPSASPNGAGSGSSYVIFGGRDFGGGSGGNVIAGTPGNDVLKGASAAEIFEAGDGNDKMIGRGGADMFRGGAGDDYIQVADLGFGSVDGGSGNDTLHLDGKDLNLDLANFGNRIHGIETICLYGRGDNALTLTATNLLDLSDTSNTLRVNGNAGDHITIQDDGWVDGGPRGSGYYHVYTHDDAVLLVGQNVTVDFA
ncbi:FG-GAP repeat protein [Nitrosomonas sp. Nm84]|uniref:FG-GAP repeat protein n=1 Tax=Nitrosomonas sp. Nm84 TaxID=200124 RepID=UPI000D761ADC|nr:FG-GAP repeat protein [Nitrosomonas sp. Nm84]PXW89871.1 FG-GAP repeat protein [Nitrosomonas sp. Nm84]